MTGMVGQEESLAPAAPPHQEWHAPFNPWLIAFVSTIATFMEVLDTTIVNVSLPHIAGNLGVEVEDSTWVLTSYLVSNAIILPLSAWFSSVLGRRNYYLICIALFTTSSFCCGLAPNLGLLVLFRLIQGIGGGGLQPSTQAIMVDTFPARLRGMSMAIYGMTVVVAPIIGPTLGGWITDNFSWRWVFFINVPIGILAVVLCSHFITDPPYLIRRRGKDRFRVDFIGLGLISLGIGCLQTVLDLGERKDWFSSNLITDCAIIAGVALVVGLIWELIHDDPIVDLRLLRDRNFGVAVAIMLVFGCALYASTALLPLFMQTLLGYTSMQSGLAISPGGLVVMAMMPFIGWAVNRVDVRLMIGFGMLVIAYSLYDMGFFNPLIDFWTVVNARIIQSFGLSFIFVPINTVAYAYIAKEHRGSASSLINLARNLGGSVGISLTTSLITRRSQVHQVFLSEHLSPYIHNASVAYHELAARMTMHFGSSVTGALAAKQALYLTVLQQARALAFEDAFRFVAPLILVAAPLVLLMRLPKEQSDDIPVH